PPSGAGARIGVVRVEHRPRRRLPLIREFSCLLRSTAGNRYGVTRPWARVAPILLAVAVLAGMPSGASAAPVAAAPSCTPRVLVLSAMPVELDPLLAQAKVDRTVVVGNRTFYV